MPIIEGADMTTVSTSFKPYGEGVYQMLVKSSELASENRQLRIKMEIEDAPDSADVGKPFTHFINIVQNDGKKNQIGLETIKRYLEAAYGKGSDEANQNDTDYLNGRRVRLYLTVGSYKKGQEDIPTNEVKKILPV